MIKWLATDDPGKKPPQGDETGPCISRIPTVMAQVSHGKCTAGRKAHFRIDVCCADQVLVGIKDHIHLRFKLSIVHVPADARPHQPQIWAPGVGHFSSS